MTALFDTATTAGAVDTALHLEIQHFYARHMQAVDLGDVAAWAAGFTEDGVFSTNAFPEPVVGRAAIEAATAAGEEARKPTGVIRRHVLTTLALEPAADGSVRTRSYVMVLETLPKARTEIYCSTLCEDVLVRGEHGGWLIRSRHILRDDLIARD
ncbi:nuclear transport factor 2 family protein [Kitasatospora sp. NPDC004723]|uniref:nuclear transport factor 2 family protein n=1 Tax=Kitasatospora sp. NPDC004723 TaxID=3154288 RepID=UPI0033ABE081